MYVCPGVATASVQRALGARAGSSGGCGDIVIARADYMQRDILHIICKDNT